MLYRGQLAQKAIFPRIFGRSAEGTTIRVPGEATVRWQTRDTANIAPLGRTTPSSLGRAHRAAPHGAPSAEPASSVRDGGTSKIPQWLARPMPHRRTHDRSRLAEEFGPAAAGYSAPPPFAAGLADPVALLAVELRPDLDQPPATHRAGRARFAGGIHGVVGFGVACVTGVGGIHGNLPGRTGAAVAAAAA
jgi:hypothetical protein